MVATKGRIKAGAVFGPEITHYTSTGGLNFQLPNVAEAFFDLISGYPTAGQPNPPSAQIADLAHEECSWAYSDRLKKETEK